MPRKVSNPVTLSPYGLPTPAGSDQPSKVVPAVAGAVAGAVDPDVPCTNFGCAGSEPHAATLSIRSIANRLFTAQVCRLRASDESPWGIL